MSDLGAGGPCAPALMVDCGWGAGLLSALYLDEHDACTYFMARVLRISEANDYEMSAVTNALP